MSGAARNLASKNSGLLRSQVGRAPRTSSNSSSRCSLVDATERTHQLTPEASGLRCERHGDQGLCFTSRPCGRVPSPTYDSLQLSSLHGGGGTSSVHYTVSSVRWPVSAPVRLQTGRDGNEVAPPTEELVCPPHPPRTKDSPRAFRRPRGILLFATEGARSVNREVASSTVTRERPVKARRKATPGGAVADAERARAAGRPCGQLVDHRRAGPVGALRGSVPPAWGSNSRVRQVFDRRRVRWIS